MALLTCYTTTRLTAPRSARRTQALHVWRLWRAPVRIPTKALRGKLRRRAKAICGASDSGKSHPRTEGKMSKSMDAPAASVPSETLFSGEAFDQTLYVEKGAVEERHGACGLSVSNIVQAEVVPDSPSFSLVRTAQPMDRRNQNKLILAEIVAIALPALGTVLADPLMSLVDTACVGQISAVQLAALGPNTAIFNMIFAIFGVLGAALANRIARNSLKAPGLGKKEKRERRKQNETVLSHTLVLAISLGLTVTGILFAFGPHLLRFMGTSSSVMTAALHYLYVRAIATPAVLFIAVSQGACLGQQDMWTPMKVVLAAGLVNLVGDIALISFMGFGTMGAAAATAAAQIAGAVYFYFYLRNGGADRKGVQLKWKGLPTLATLQPIFDMGRVLVARSVVLMMAYMGMTSVATTMGTQILAAHQVVLQLFWFLSYVPEPLALTAQSLLARDRNDKSKTSSVSKVLLKFGANSGLVLAAIFGVTLTFMARCFTSDLSVIATLQKVIPHGMMALFFCSVSSMFDGISIGTSQLEHLPRIVYASTAATLGYLWMTQRLNLGLNGIWVSMIIFFASRDLLHVAHLVKNWKLSPFSGLAPAPVFEPQLASSY